MIRISRASFELSLVASIIKESESLFLALLAQRERVGSGKLRLAAVELHKLLFELLAGLFQFALVFGVVFLELLELGVELVGEKRQFGSEINRKPFKSHLLFAILQLSFLLLDAHHEHLTNFVFLGLQLGDVVGSLGLEGLLEGNWLVLAVDVGEAHLLQALLTVELVVACVRLLAHVLHVGADQHLPQLDKIAMSFVLDLDDALEDGEGQLAVVRDEVQLLTHGYCLARIILLPNFTNSVLPTTAKGT
jgi:hypothetical protein